MSPNLSDSRRSPIWTRTRIASLTPRVSRWRLARSVIEGGLSKAVAARRFTYDAEDGSPNGSHGSAPRAPTGLTGSLVTGPTHRQDQTPPCPHAKGSRLCAGQRHNRRADRRGSRVFRPPRSAAYLKRLGLNRLFRSRTGREPIRRYTSAQSTRRRSSTSTSKKLGKFNRIGHTRHRRAHRPEQVPEGSAGNMCIWRSTNHYPGLPIRKSCRTRSEAPACVILFNALRFFRSLGVIGRGAS